MLAFSPQAYGPVFSPLLAVDRHRPLDAGKPAVDSRAALSDLTTDAAFAHGHVADRDMAACCVAGVWLLHDCLDESHSISQSIETQSGSFWHAILHRREGDYWNSKYWFRRVGTHAVLEPLCQEMAELARAHGGEQLGRKLLAGGELAFVDLCEATLNGNDRTLELCLDVQQAEWELLFDDCYRKALGS